MAMMESEATSRDEEMVLNVLDVIERDPVVTQRSVARELGIALGLANAYLKRCIRKGLIKVSDVPPRRYAYYLTPRGFAEKSRLTTQYLSHSFSFFRRARNQCKDIFQTAVDREHRRIALIGHGDLAEIAELVAREQGVEIAGVVQASGDAAELSRKIASLGSVEAAVITAHIAPRETYNAAVEALGSDRVYVPALLRVHLLSNGIDGA